MTGDQTKDLINRIRSGDRDAFREIVDSHQRLVYNIVFRMVSREADREDLCQDIFVKVYRNLAGFKQDAKLSTWIARIAYNTCINALRKKRVPLYEDESQDIGSVEAYGGGTTPDELATRSDLAERLQAEIERLPPRFRTILTLFHLEEMSYAEIAEIMDLPDGTVKSYLFRARKMLNARLSARYKPEEFMP